MKHFKNVAFFFLFFFFLGNGAGAHVYILDTGIRTTHEEFENRATFVYDAMESEPVNLVIVLGCRLTLKYNLLFLIKNEILSWS